MKEVFQPGDMVTASSTYNPIVLWEVAGEYSTDVDAGSLQHGQLAQIICWLPPVYCESRWGWYLILAPFGLGYAAETCHFIKVS